MNILVTGGAGYIGSHTSISLLQAGYNPIIADDFINCLSDSIQRIEKITQKHVTYYKGNVCDLSFLENIFAVHKIGGIIHFAALKSVNDSIKEPLQYYSNNLISLINLLTMAEKYGVNRFVFSSSASIYDPTTIPPFRETDAICSEVPYARTKIMGEEITTDFAKSNPHIGVAILRYFNPIGAHPSGDIGEVVTASASNIMPNLLSVALGEKDRLHIFGDDYDTHDGTCIRDYIHVMDIAEGHVAALSFLGQAHGASFFNLGTGKGTSILELITEFEKINSVRLPYAVYSRRDGDIPVSYACANEAKRILGWTTTRSLSDMVRDSWKWALMQNV